MKTVLITGVAGFLGRYVAKRFFTAGWKVIGVDSQGEENGPREFMNRYLFANLPDDRIAGWIAEEQPSLVVHCAGRASVPFSISDPAADFDGNAVLTFRLLDALRLHAPQCRFILLSSAAVYGNPEKLPVTENSPLAPISPYGFHKRQAELACQEFAVAYGLRTCSLRIFSAYGPGLRRQVLWDLSAKAMSSDVLQLMGTGSETRDFVHARDVALAVDLVAHQGDLQGEVYNLASGIETSIASLAEQILDSLNRKISIEFDGHQPQGDPLRWRADISRLSNLGYAPSIEFSEGVQEYVRWATPLIG